MRDIPTSPAPPRAAPRFAFWRLGLWVIVLLSAFGIVQYQLHARQVLAQLDAVPARATDAIAALRQMLAWDLLYLVAAVVLLVLCGAGILRQRWSRSVLRVALSVLALWMLFTGVLLLRQWQMFNNLPPGLAQAAAAQVAQARRAIELGLLLKAISVLLPAWLVWRLGVPGVRSQFRTRR